MRQIGELIDDVLFLSELESGAGGRRRSARRALPILEEVAEALGEQAARAGVTLRAEGDRGRAAAPAADDPRRRREPRRERDSLRRARGDVHARGHARGGAAARGPTTASASPRTTCRASSSASTARTRTRLARNRPRARDREAHRQRRRRDRRGGRRAGLGSGLAASGSRSPARNHFFTAFQPICPQRAGHSRIDATTTKGEQWEFALTAGSSCSCSRLGCSPLAVAACGRSDSSDTGAAATTGAGGQDLSGRIEVDGSSTVGPFVTAGGRGRSRSRTPASR